MLRRQKQVRIQVQKFLDAGLFGVSLWIAHYLAVNLKPDIEPFEEFLWLFLLIIPAAPACLESQGFYTRNLLTARRITAWQLFRGVTVSFMLLIGLIFLFKETLARTAIILFAPVAFTIVLLKEELIRRWMLSKWGQAQFRRRLILAGTREDSVRFLSDMQKSGGSESFEIVGTLNLNEASVDDLIKLLHEHSANGVVLSARHAVFGQIEKAIQACEVEGVEAWLLADFFNTQISQTTLDEFNGRPMLVFRSTPEDSWQKLAKQVLDVCGALVFLLFTSPFFVIFGLMVKWTSPGPVFFRQKRSGLNGKPFTMLKFRSMVTDAEQLKAELEALNEMDGPVFKVTNDPRVTSIGRFLRRFSIDEWPQMINVLLGDMSLVGPRPLPVDEVNRFDDLAHRRRLSVKPGITCLWQIKGRNNVKDFRDWVRLDLEYIDNWSLWLDLKILVRTVPVVVMGTGAK